MPVSVEVGVEALRHALAPLRSGHRRIGLVPTMGALHAGHASLIARAREECGAVVVSIFVNPLQFDRPDDLERYPRPFEADLALCRSLGVDVVFSPTPTDMYPSGDGCAVDPGPVAESCCGRYRPGHFRGVATVVTKLLNIVQPDVGYFGEKDAQQLALIRRLVEDLNMPVTIVGVPTVREPDGLAVSSRNAHLDAAGRRAAPALYAALREAAGAVARGVVDPRAVAAVAEARIPADDTVRLEYVEVVDPDLFRPVDRVTRPAVIAGAMWVGQTRIIDNVRALPPEG
jgi:pantoate--beta-alanine ligase